MMKLRCARPIILLALTSVVFLLSGCGGPKPISLFDVDKDAYGMSSDLPPPPAVEEDAPHMPPEPSYGCEVGDPIKGCEWELPDKGGPVTVKAVVEEWSLNVTVNDEIDGCHVPAKWSPPTLGKVKECGSSSGIIDTNGVVPFTPCCITAEGTVLDASSGFRVRRLAEGTERFRYGVRFRYEDGKFVRFVRVE